MKLDILSLIPTSKKLAVDVIWSMASLCIMVVAGVCLNAAIAKFYDASVLGVFNQVYAVYILLSQFSVWGVHLSVLKSVGQSTDDSDDSVTISAALLLTLCTATIVLVLSFFLREFFGHILGSKGVAIGFLYVLPGVFFFSLNKVILALHNGRRRMKAYAVFQSLRYIFLLSFLIVLINTSVDGSKVSVIFSLSESLLFLIMVIYTSRLVRFTLTGDVSVWIKRHFSHGSRAALGNILADANTRVDVVMLGIFASDRVVGIYSLAAMAAEGFNQLLVVLRTNLNPVISRYKHVEGVESLERIVSVGKRYIYKILIPLGLVSVVLFPVAIYLVGFDPEYMQGWKVFVILMAGIMFGAGYIPFQMILNQVGYPSHQTVLLSLVFGTNLLLNLLLIPFWGMTGAAIATGASFALQVFYIKYLTYKAIRINI